MQLIPEPLTKDNFAPFGEVVEAGATGSSDMNRGAFHRFDNLARIAPASDGESNPQISIVRSAIGTATPYEFNLVEKHPLCSQAFIPLARFPFYLVVGPAGEEITPEQLKAFVTNGRQGISYNRGTWHMPLIALEAGQEFLVVDEAERAGNLVEKLLPDYVTLLT